MTPDEVMQKKQLMLVLNCLLFFNVHFYTGVFFLCATRALAPPPLVTNRQKSSLKSLKIKTCLVQAKSIREICLQSVRQSK